MASAILAAVAGPRGPKAAAAGEAWARADSAVAGSAAVVADGVVVDFVAEVVFDASVHRGPTAQSYET